MKVSLESMVGKSRNGLFCNQAINLVNGEYVAFLDADDTVESSYYKKALNVITSYDNVSFVGCWSKYLFLNV